MSALYDVAVMLGLIGLVCLGAVLLGKLFEAFEKVRGR